LFSVNAASFGSQYTEVLASNADQVSCGHKSWTRI